MLVVIANATKPKALKFLKEIKEVLDKTHLNHQLIANFPFSPDEIKHIQKGDIIVVLGGDGTTLNAFKAFSPNYQKIVLHVNFGSFGFMSGINEQATLSCIKEYDRLSKKIKDKKGAIKALLALEKNWSVVKKRLLSVEAPQDNYSGKLLCLNEVVVSSKDAGKPSSFQVFVENVELCNVLSDGILISTPTGSTAYNLSAGGPILLSDVPATVLNVINPHSLSIRPLVVNQDQNIEIRNHKDAILTLDGAVIAEISTDSKILISLSKKKLTFLQDKSFNQNVILKKKLNWGQSRYVT